MPIVNVPVGISSESMPIGIQIVGKPYETETVFKVAYKQQLFVVPHYPNWNLR